VVGMIGVILYNKCGILLDYHDKHNDKRINVNNVTFFYYYDYIRVNLEKEYNQFVKLEIRKEIQKQIKVDALANIINNYQ